MHWNWKRCAFVPVSIVVIYEEPTSFFRVIDNFFFYFFFINYTLVSDPATDHQLWCLISYALMFLLYLWVNDQPYKWLHQWMKKVHPVGSNHNSWKLYISIEKSRTAKNWDLKWIRISYTFFFLSQLAIRVGKWTLKTQIKIANMNMHLNKLCNLSPTSWISFISRIKYFVFSCYFIFFSRYAFSLEYSIAKLVLCKMANTIIQNGEKNGGKLIVIQWVQWLFQNNVIYLRTSQRESEWFYLLSKMVEKTMKKTTHTWDLSELTIFWVIKIVPSMIIIE